MKPLARYASLNRYLEMCRSTGIDPGQQLKQVGLTTGGLAVPDQWIPAPAIAKLLEISAVASGREDFGLRMAESRRLSNLGMLSLVIREEPDVRSALNVLIRYEHTYNESLRIRLIERDDIARIRIWLELGEPGECRQSLELAAGVTHGILRELLDGDWQPVSVNFEHAAPSNMSTHRRIFRDRVSFGHEHTELVMRVSDLDRPNELSDKLMRPFVQQVLDSLPEAGAATTMKRVSELIELLLPAGRCSIEQVSRSLGVDRRTVHRQLAAAGDTFTALVNSARTQMATRFIANNRYSLTDIAMLLGFSTPGSFSRWFRTQFDQTPRDWRRDHVT